MNGPLENGFINIKNTSFEIVAEVESGDRPVNGVIVAQGGRFGGWALHVKDGVPRYTYNYLGLEHSVAAGTAKLPSGKSTIKMDFAYDGGEKPGAGGTVTLYVVGKSVGSVKVIRRSSQSSQPTNRPVSASTWKPPCPKSTTARAASSSARSTR